MKRYYISFGMCERYNWLLESGPKEIKKIENFRDYIKNNHIYKIKLYICEAGYFYAYQQSEFSKEKYFSYIIDEISLGEGYSAIIPEVFESENFSYSIDNKEFIIEQLDKHISRMNSDIKKLENLLKNVIILPIPLIEPTIELSDEEEALLKESDNLEVEEQEESEDEYL